MTLEEFILCLDLLPGFGPAKFHELLEVYQTTEEMFEQWKNRKIPGLSLGEDLVSQLKLHLHKLDANGVGYAWFGGPNYPKNLMAISDPPIVIYYVGEIAKLSSKAIAIVGSRKTTKAGEEFTNRVCTDLISAGYQIISGMAFGIDGFAHSAALQNNAFSLAVLPANPHLATPASHQHLHRQLQQSGAVISENIFKPVVPGMFASRNRIIAGIGLATVVVEAGEGSGSLITANAAFDYGRQVFAVPGDINNPYSKGCNQLIKQNKAKLIESAEDILVEIDPNYSKITPHFNFSLLSDIDKKLLDLLGGKRLSLDQICQAVDMSPSNAISYLSALEVSGAIFQDENLNYSVR